MRARRRTQIGRRVDNSTANTGTVLRPGGSQITFTAGQPAISIDTTITTSQAAITFTAGAPAIETVKHQAVAGSAITFTAGQPTVTIVNPPSANKVFQLTPASIQQSGGSVTSWDDEIAAYDFTPGTAPTVASAALNGYDVVEFDDASSQYLASSYTPSGTLTILLVAKFTVFNDAGSAHQLCACHDVSNPDGGFTINDSNLSGISSDYLGLQTGIGGAWVSGAIYTGSTSLDSSWHIYGLTVSASTTKLIKDAVVYTDNSHGAIAAALTLTLGGYNGTGLFGGQIAEVIYWDDDLDTDLSTEIAALQTKYAL